MGHNGNGFQIEFNTLELFTECGGIYSNSSSILTSPSHPNPYPQLADCVYLISQPDRTFINISFLFIDIDCQGTQTDFIEMRDGKFEDSPLMTRFCGNDSILLSFIQTTQNHLRIRWGSELSYKNLIIQFVTSYFSDSFPTTLGVGWDSSLNINPLVSRNGATTVVHVEAILQLKMASSPHHHTQATTLQMRIAFTSSLSQMQHVSLSPSSQWM